MKNYYEIQGNKILMHDSRMKSTQYINKSIHFRYGINSIPKNELFPNISLLRFILDYTIVYN